MGDDRAPVAIVGGGITGLALAWRLMRDGRDVVLLEQSPRAGGAIRSEHVNGLLLEHGAQTLLPSARNTWEVIRGLGVGEQVLETAPTARQRFILWQGRLMPVPRAFLDRRFLPRTALLRALAEPLVPLRERVREDETVFAFVARRFGRRIAERLADPFIAGTFGGDARHIEVAAAFPELVRLERTRGSVLLGGLFGRGHKDESAPKRTFSFSRGMETLPRALAEALGTRLRLESPVERIERLTRGFRIHAAGGPYDAANVVCCLPPSRASSLLPELGAELAAMPRASVASVYLGWPLHGVDHPPQGFGWLAPSSERTDVLGCLWVSSLFPDHAPGHVLMRVMIGGAREPNLPEASALIERARGIVRTLHGIEVDPVLARVSIATIPQYERGHVARVRRLQAAVPGLSFAGWGYTGIGLEPCIREALSLGVDSTRA